MYSTGFLSLSPHTNYVMNNDLSNYLLLHQQLPIAYILIWQQVQNNIVHLLVCVNLVNFYSKNVFLVP
jgi:hypothetical protein